MSLAYSVGLNRFLKKHKDQIPPNITQINDKLEHQIQFLVDGYKASVKLTPTQKRLIKETILSEKERGVLNYWDSALETPLVKLYGTVDPYLLETEINSKPQHCHRGTSRNEQAMSKGFVGSYKSMWQCTDYFWSCKQPYPHHDDPLKTKEENDKLREQIEKSEFYCNCDCKFCILARGK